MEDKLFCIASNIIRKLKFANFQINLDSTNLIGLASLTTSDSTVAAKFQFVKFPAILRLAFCKLARQLIQRYHYNSANISDFSLKEPLDRSYSLEKTAVFTLTR